MMNIRNNPKFSTLIKKSIASTVLALALTHNPTWALTTADKHTDTHLRHTLHQAGLQSPIISISPSPINDMFIVTLSDGQEPLLISRDGKYVIQGQLEHNPSPIHPIAPDLLTPRPAGTPISDDYKHALLANMSVLTALDQDAAFYHTNVPELLWGVSGTGTPFLISQDGRHLINGEISVIKDGQFAGLDTALEFAKNRHVLSTLDPKALINYPAKGKPQGTLYVATDIHCPYCRLLHTQIDKLNAQGISVHVIGFVVYDESDKPMQHIWCQSDNAQRASMLNAAMKGIISSQSCPTNRLKDNQLKAQSLAIHATPAIFNANGELFEGDFTQSVLVDFAKHPKSDVNR